MAFRQLLEKQLDCIWVETELFKTLPKFYDGGF